MLTMLGYSWSTLARPALWAGVLAGVAMILGAVRLRRWRDEG
jgi:ABC-2 type transport system permease protein